MNKNALVFAVSNDLVFSLAVVLLSLKENSYSVFSSSDIIIYTDTISEPNQTALNKIHPNIYIREFEDGYDEIYNHKFIKEKRWGKWVIPKLFCFELINYYENVLFLDCDMYVYGDISEIFNSSEISWVRVTSWTGTQLLEKFLKDPKDHPSAPNGGLVFLSSQIRNYNIDKKDIIAAFHDIKDINIGGIDERILSYIVYTKNIVVKELDNKYNALVAHSTVDNAVIVHFTGVDNPKPWTSPIINLVHPDWMFMYKKWLNLGGEGLKFSFENFALNSKYNFLRFLQNYPRLCEIGIKLHLPDNLLIQPPAIGRGQYFQYLYIRGSYKSTL